MTDTEATLIERNKIHGDFIEDARVAQDIKFVMQSAKNWGKLDAHQAEALHLIATKIARILSGNPDHADHWDDLQGYARLGKDPTVKEAPRRGL